MKIDYPVNTVEKNHVPAEKKEARALDLLSPAQTSHHENNKDKRYHSFDALKYLPPCPLFAFHISSILQIGTLRVCNWEILAHGHRDRQKAGLS